MAAVELVVVAVEAVQIRVASAASAPEIIVKHRAPAWVGAVATDPVEDPVDTEVNIQNYVSKNIFSINFSPSPNSYLC